jgi:hypothetical protein
VLLDGFDASDTNIDVLKAHAAHGYRILQITYRPGANESAAQVVVEGLSIDVLVCTHPPGPAVCWCREPLPGLGVVAVETYALDPQQCIVVGESSADRGFAERLGFRVVSPEAFFAAESVSD